MAIAPHGLPFQPQAQGIQHSMPGNSASFLSGSFWPDVCLTRAHQYSWWREVLEQGCKLDKSSLCRLGAKARVTPNPGIMDAHPKTAGQEFPEMNSGRSDISNKVCSCYHPVPWTAFSSSSSPEFIQPVLSRSYAASSHNLQPESAKR